MRDAGIIFLDIDGCLTSVEDGSSFMCMKPDDYRLSERCLEKLDRLLDETGASVIISSNWRHFPPDGYWNARPGIRFRSPLPSLKAFLGGRCVGELPPARHLTKSEALAAWLERTGAADSLEFAIIDDDADEGYANYPRFRERYVECDPLFGLTDADCDAVKEILEHGAKERVRH